MEQKLKKIHNLIAIDSDIEMKLVSIRGKLTPNKLMDEKTEHIAKVSYKAITGLNAPNGCQSCNSMIKILNNWLNGFYDTKAKALKPVKASTEPKKTETILSMPNPTYKELLKEATIKGYDHKGKGRPSKVNLIDFLKS